MASQRGGFSAILVLFLCLCLYLEVFKPYQTPANGAFDIMLALKLDKKQFPTRNTCGLPRYSVPCAGLPVSRKMEIGLHLLNVTMAASSLVLLAGDVSMNPGPILDGLPRARGLRVAHLNVRSLVDKMDDMGHLVQYKWFDIFTVSETWLNPTILDNELNLTGYIVVRHDRNIKRGGGMAIFVRNGIPYKHLTELSDEGCETCWIEINRVKCKKLYVCCVYRPDYCCHSLIEHLHASLAKLRTESETLILGDLNADFSAKKNFSHIN